MNRFIIVPVTLYLILLGCGEGGSFSEQANDFGGRGTNNVNTQLEPVLDILDLSDPEPTPNATPTLVICMSIRSIPSTPTLLVRRRRPMMPTATRKGRPSCTPVALKYSYALHWISTR